jgi:diamine N-acetyltransferase
MGNTLLSAKIEPVQDYELATLVAISRRTFSDAFSTENTPEDMSAFLDTFYAPEKIADELANENSQFFFAKINGEVAGYMKINFGNAQSEHPTEPSLEIERIYVLETFIGQKIGQQLMNKAFEQAQQHGLDCVWLGVWEKNVKAIKFYERNGFSVFDTHIFIVGSDPQTDLMMKKTGVLNSIA